MYILLQVTPLGIAFLKGHMGLADILLDRPGVDINFRDDEGTQAMLNSYLYSTGI